MDVYEALYTTRAMRRVRPDPIPEAVQRKILDAAIRAPSGGNAQNWRFLLVDDPGIRQRIAAIYRDCISQLWKTIYKDRLDQARANPDDPESRQFQKVYRSAEWLADHFAEVPLLLFSFVQMDTSGGSIYPATWSAMLAARAEGVGSALTSVMLFRDREVKDILGVPAEGDWHMSSCVTFGYPTGRWGVAPRQPVHQVAARNAWDGPPGFEVPTPLWPPK